MIQVFLFLFFLLSICLTPIPSLHILYPPQDVDLFVPAVFQCLAAAGPHRAVLRLAGGQHSPGGVSGGRAPRGHRAAGRGDARSLYALRLLTAGKIKKYGKKLESV